MLTKSTHIVIHTLRKLLFGSGLLRLAMVLLGTLFLASQLYAQSFKHPGIYSTKEQLDFVKAKIQQGKQPWKKAFDELKASNPTKRVPKGYSAIAGSSKPRERKDMDNFVRDGSHAYASALLWYFTDERRYADYTIRVLNEWAVFDKIPMWLYATWGIPHYLNAAEIMKHTPNSGWRKADIDAFTKMVRKEMIVKVDPPPGRTHQDSNHGATAIEAHLAAAIFLDDRKEFNRALDSWRSHIPTYLYMNRPGRAQGESLETCRDLNHVKLGSGGIMDAAEVAWNQGVDLWREQKNRLRAFAELHSGIMDGTRSIPSNMCAHKQHAGRVFCRGGVSWATPSGRPPCNQTAWEPLINHLGSRLGMKIPLTEGMARKLDGDPIGELGRRNEKWVTLLKSGVPTSNAGSVNIPVVETPVAKQTGYEGRVNLPGRIEAEHYYKTANEFEKSNRNRRAINKCTYYGLGVDVQDSAAQTCNIGWTSPGEELIYRVGAAGGKFNVKFRVASQASGNRIDMLVNDTIAGSVSSAGNGWQSYTTEVIEGVEVPLDATITVRFLDGNANLDWIDFEQATSARPVKSNPEPVASIPSQSEPELETASIPPSIENCATVYLRERKELALENIECVTFDTPLNGKVLSVWDSDEHNCDFRGTINAIDGTTLLNVNANYVRANDLSGRTISINATNGCKFVKIRYY